MSKSVASREAFEAWLDTKARLWCIDGHSADLMREAAQWSRSQALEEAAQAVARYRDETSGDTESSLRAQFDSQIDLDVAVFGSEEERRNFICFVMDGRVAILQTCIALIGGWRPDQP